jgi:hypothetical protein
MGPGGNAYSRLEIRVNEILQQLFPLSRRHLRVVWAAQQDAQDLLFLFFPLYHLLAVQSFSLILQQDDKYFAYAVP